MCGWIRHMTWRVEEMEWRYEEMLDLGEEQRSMAARMKIGGELVGALLCGTDLDTTCND